MKIYVKNNDINKALRVLKKKLYEEGESKELRQRQYFISSSEQRRLDERAGAKRWAKKRAQIEKNLERAERQLIQKNRKRTAATQNKSNLANR